MEAKAGVNGGEQETNRVGKNENKKIIS